MVPPAQMKIQLRRRSRGWIFRLQWIFLGFAKTILDVCVVIVVMSEREPRWKEPGKAYCHYNSFLYGDFGLMGDAVSCLLADDVFRLMCVCKDITGDLFPGVCVQKYPGSFSSAPGLNRRSSGSPPRLLKKLLLIGVLAIS